MAAKQDCRSAAQACQQCRGESDRLIAAPRPAARLVAALAVTGGGAEPRPLGGQLVSDVRDSRNVPGLVLRDPEFLAHMADFRSGCSASSGPSPLRHPPPDWATSAILSDRLARSAEPCTSENCK